MLDIEQKIRDGLDGCYFVFDELGRTVNVGTGFAPWEKQKALEKKLEAERAAAAKVVPPKFSPGHSPVFKDVVAAVSSVTEIAPSLMLSQTRIRQVARSRQAVMRISRAVFPTSWLWLGRKMGVDHSTVVHAVLGLKPEHAEKVEVIVAAAMGVLRRNFPKIDEIVTEVKEFRNQQLSGDNCHECQAE